jgi:hypothetical protein
MPSRWIVAMARLLVGQHYREQLGDLLGERPLDERPGGLGGVSVTPLLQAQLEPDLQVHLIGRQRPDRKPADDLIDRPFDRPPPARGRQVRLHLHPGVQHPPHRG